MIKKAQKMNLLVTGGAGFIGSNLIRLIIDRPLISKLVNLDCLTYAGKKENLEDISADPKYIFEKVDLRDAVATAEVIKKHGITHVLHLAAESHVDRSIAGPDDFVQTNIVGTHNLLSACRAAWGDAREGKRFVHVSTDEVYGSLGPKGLFTEESPYAPNSPYSASKASSDLLVRAYERTYGFPAIITHCSNNFGPYQFPEKLIPVTIASAREEKEIPVYGDGMQVRDWIYVLDHCEALWKVLLEGKPGQTYNIGGANEIANLRLVEMIADKVDKALKRPTGTSRKLIAFVTDRLGHDQRYAIDGSKIERELGWKPRYTFETALDETVRWYLSR